MDSYDRFIYGLKKLVDQELESNYRAHGPMRVRFGQHTDSKGKQRRHVLIDAPDSDGWVEISASPTGKNLHVRHSKVTTHDTP